MVFLLRRLPLVVVAVAALAAVRCGGAETAPPVATTPRTVTPMPATIQVPPGGTTALGFQVTGPTGAPVPGATVTFAIVEDPTVPDAKAQGATLASASATTDAQGLCGVRVTGGLATAFLVRATSANATADVLVVVIAAGQAGAVDVAPFFPVPDGAHAAAVAATIDVLFFDNRSCADLDVRDPPVPVRGPMSLLVNPGGIPVASFTSLATNAAFAIVGRARDGRGGIRALGCVDLPGRALVPGGTVQIALPLVDAGPDPVGTYAATSPLPIAPPLATAGTIGATWRDLTDCPLDPAQLWLDCTIDALGPAGPDDPLDCVPSTTPGGDGALGDALGALRGTLVPGPDGAASACRGSRTAGGAISLDAVLQGMFGSPLPATLVQLAAAGADGAHIFDDLQLRSTLEVRAGDTLADAAVTHTLTSVSFGMPSATEDVPLVTLGLPVLSAATTGLITDDTLTIARHGFTVRLGSAARVGFGLTALQPRGLPTDATGVVAAIASLAHSDDGKLAGCVALDAALCPRAGQAAGCLVTACATGLNALAARLDASFDAADGAGLDLYLAGSAPLLETHDDGLAGRLGDLQAGASAASWTVDLRPREGRRTFSAPWEAVRSGD
ncbi:MAG TPA: hypothetical protein VHL80_07700 [Polyangia bacterium]|nr:hypothetical protein [Polyangia bacterium]